MRRRFALAAGLVLGERQQRPAALSERRLGHPGLRLTEHLSMVPGPQAGIDVDLLGVKAKLVQPGRLGPARIPVLQFSQRAAPARVLTPHR